jgi:hypothetical protein
MGGEVPVRPPYVPPPGLPIEVILDLPPQHVEAGLANNLLPSGDPHAALGQSTGLGPRPNCGWHGTALDGERGFYGVVRRDGPLAWWFGRVVRITHYQDPRKARHVVVYVHGLIDDLLEDVSLTRRAFLSLASLSVEEIAVVGEVVEE